MSRFFAMGGSDVDSDDSSSDNSGMGGQMQNREQTQTAMLMYDSSSSEEEKRVVRSAKDKRYEAMNAAIKTMRNSVKINDWVQVLKGFDQINKLLEKARTIIQKEGIPRMYVKTLVHLEDKVSEAQENKEMKSKMSTANNRALNTIKQKLRKNNKEYERFINEYRSAPDAFSEEEPVEQESSEESESESEESEEDEDDDGSGAMSSDQSKSDDDEDGAAQSSASDDFDFSDADSSSSESDIDLSHPAMSRSFWVKKTKDDEEELTKADRRRQRQAPKADKKVAKVKTDQKDPEKEIEYTPELIHQKLNMIQSMRGKRGADRHAAVKDLKLLSTKASSVPAILKVKITLLSAMFDVNFNSGSHMQIALWQSALDILTDILSVLEQNKGVHLIEEDDIEETVFAGDDIDTPLPPIEEEGVPVVEAGELRTFAPQARRKRDDGQEYVAGSVYSFVARLSDEYVASLQNIDPHTQDYLDRLSDEPSLMRLMHSTQQYYTAAGKQQFVNLIALMRIEYLYVKYDPLYDETSPEFRHKSEGSLSVITGEDILLHRLCSILYESGDSRSKARAVISTAYHYAMHGAFHKARDIFLMSHVQDSIHQADVSTQILYNRALAMMSVCAFRLGYMQDALNLVGDLYATGKIKELLAQGITQMRWQQDRDSEQEKLERRRQVPYHMHVSLDLLESVHLVSAMLLEVPNLAVHASDDKRHIISRNFRRLWDSFHKNAFNGPPEYTRDYVIAAAVALRDGDWRTALDHLMQLRMWSLIPFPETAQAALTTSVKEVALQTFLLALGANYTTLSGAKLAARFDMSERDVHAVASKLMANDRLAGAWDEPIGSIRMKGILPNELQLSALRFADQIGILVEQNERGMEHRHSHAKSNAANGFQKSGADSWQGRQPQQLQSTRPVKVGGDDASRRW